MIVTLALELVLLRSSKCFWPWHQQQVHQVFVLLLQFVVVVVIAAVVLLDICSGGGRSYCRR